MEAAGIPVGERGVRGGQLVYPTKRIKEGGTPPQAPTVVGQLHLSQGLCLDSGCELPAVSKKQKGHEWRSKLKTLYTY